MKTISIILVALFLATTVGAADLDANGHDWLKYGHDEKVSLIESICKKLDINTEEYTVDDLIMNLDAMYGMDNAAVLNTSCITLVPTILEQSKELDKYKRGGGN